MLNFDNNSDIDCCFYVKLISLKKKKINIIMNEFPEDLTLENCQKKMEEKQFQLYKNTIESFYKKIMEKIDYYDNIILLVFPPQLCKKFRNKITEQLLKKFGKLNIKMSTQTHLINKMISEIIELNNDLIEEIKIEINFTC